MDNEYVAHLQLNIINLLRKMKFTEKDGAENNHSEWVNSDPERHTLHFPCHLWMLALSLQVNAFHLEIHREVRQLVNGNRELLLR